MTAKYTPEERKDRRRLYRRIMRNYSTYSYNGKPKTIGDYKQAVKERYGQFTEGW